VTSSTASAWSGSTFQIVGATNRAASGSWRARTARFGEAGIRERIYVGGSGYGILLYTASPDAEGTLGGLVEAADRLDG
jgi:hypothetical protein